MDSERGFTLQIKKFFILSLHFPKQSAILHAILKEQGWDDAQHFLQVKLDRAVMPDRRVSLRPLQESETPL